MAARALAPFISSHLRLHTVANVDGADLGDTLKRVPLETTLFIVCSKTFTTIETMTNAATARKPSRQCSARRRSPSIFARCPPSSIKSPLSGSEATAYSAFGLGWRPLFDLVVDWAFAGDRNRQGEIREILQGGQDIDTHFVEAPLDRNISGSDGHARNLVPRFLGCAAHAVIPYDERMARFPAYLQQLEMESNGKSVDLSGTRVDTRPRRWFSENQGRNGQHAFFQMLHQGTTIVPIDFLVAARPSNADAAHHNLLFANCLAQSQASCKGVRSRWSGSD